MFAAGFAVDAERMRGWRPAAGRALLAAESAVRLPAAKSDIGAQRSKPPRNQPRLMIV